MFASTYSYYGYIGYLCNNRLISDEDLSLFGFFLNLIPLKINCATLESNKVINSVEKARNEILNYKEYPYPYIQEMTKSQGYLYNWTFDYVDFIDIDKYSSKEIDSYTNTGTDDLNNQLFVRHIKDKYTIAIKYSDLNRDNTFLFDFKRILKEILNKKQINLLDIDEYNKIIYNWNQTDKSYPQDKTVYQLFEEQTKQNPGNVALVFEDQELTYKELNDRSNQLARYIREQYKQVTNKELKPDTLIPLCLERSLDMVIGILGVMKAGGAYVPMDPEYPAKRFKYILTDTQAKLVITQSYLEDKLTKITNGLEKNINLVSINPVINSQIPNQVIYDKEDKTNLNPLSKATDLVYVIYTSGTTGMPKGVMIEHGSLVNYLSNSILEFDNEISNVDLSTNLAFDLTITCLFSSLIIGKKIFIYSGENKNIDKYINHLEKNKIDFIKATTSYLSVLSFKNIYIKKAFVGGEKLESDTLRKIKKVVGRVIDEYGPTEVTVGSHKAEKEVEISNGIGASYSNYKSYVLDDSMYPVTVGVVGELYIGGAGLARGYLNRPKLTAERFVDNPFATELDIKKGYTKLYKTGDLVRWLPDGNLEYIGRNDFQVKIRGFRIELGEIESQLSQLEGIKQSVVLDKENTKTKSQYLIGYYVPTKELGILRQEDLLNQLSKVLPEYMIPSILVELESFPLTANGKLDHRGLPDPEFIRKDSYQAPMNDLESRICSIWEEVLGIDKIGISDNFFKIGGNSLLAIKLSHKLSKELNKSISVSDISKLKYVHRYFIKFDSQ